MRTLERVTLTPGELKEPLPTVFKSLEKHGGIPRRGSVTMIAATPSAGKSFATLKLVQSMGLPTLYFSADTSAQDQIERAAAMATGFRQEKVRTDLLMGGEDYYAERLREKFGHIRWVFESDPSYEDLELETAAYAEAYGDFPQVIVIDNLVNLLGEAEGEYASQKESTKVLHRLVRVTGAGVFLVHHMNENKANNEYPAPRSDIANKLSQLPELILSLAKTSEGELRIAVVKNRSGVDDASASSWCSVFTDLATGQYYADRWHRDNEVPIK